MATRRYVHALGYRWLNRLYDPLIRLTMAERRFKQQLIDTAGMRPSMRVLDVGCGTGTLLLLLARRRIALSVGLDGDRDILAIARRKRESAHARFALVAAFSTAVPFGDGAFDRVFSTLMLHHLDDGQKLQSLSEARRVLADSGKLHVADWGRPHTASMRAAAELVKAFDGADVTRANIVGRIPDLCRDAGFPHVELRSERRTPFGTLLFDGRPVVGALVGGIYATSKSAPDDWPLKARTDQNGEVTFVLEHAGGWLFRSVHMVRASEPETPPADWESFWASLTFEVATGR